MKLRCHPSLGFPHVFRLPAGVVGTGGFEVRCWRMSDDGAAIMMMEVGGYYCYRDHYSYCCS